MLALGYLFLPFAIALIPILLRIRRKRFALIWIILSYFLYILISAVFVAVPIYQEMSRTGSGDPQLMAGRISENLVTSLLLGIITIPLSLLIFWAYRKFIAKTLS